MTRPAEAMETMSKRSIHEAASELRRELGIRRRCYGRWIADGKLDEIEARDRMERMEAALDVVERAALLATVPEKGGGSVDVSSAERIINMVDDVSPVLVTQHGLAQHGTL